MKNILDRLREEIRKILGTALFFSISFCLILLSDKLMVRGSDIELASFARAVIGGLIVAKILLIVDLLPFIDAFRGKALVYTILWKTPIYVVASLVFRYLDPLVGSLFKGMGLTAAHQQAVQEFMQPKFWAIEIWVAFLLLIFLTMKELTRALGKDEVRRIFLGPSSGKM